MGLIKNRKVLIPLTIVLSFILDFAIVFIVHAITGMYFIGHGGIPEVITILFWIFNAASREEREQQDEDDKSMGEQQAYDTYGG